MSFLTNIEETSKRHKAFTKRPERNKAIVSAYLILTQNDHTLLYLRQNTGYEDGNYGLVSGHVEKDESAKQAIIRETLEEAGIKIAIADLHCAHIMHRRERREIIDVFFTCNKWQGEIVNKEPIKCKDLSFYPVDNLPANLIGYIKLSLANIKQGIFYSETGWP